MTEKFGGKVVEAGFRDGNDNPENTSDGGLLEKKLQYFVDAGPEYKFIHSCLYLSLIEFNIFKCGSGYYSKNLK